MTFKTLNFPASPDSEASEAGEAGEAAVVAGSGSRVKPIDGFELASSRHAVYT